MTQTPLSKRCSRIALRACVAIVSLFSAAAGAAPPTGQPPLRVVGDQNYPPLSYLDGGVAKGFDVDVAKALGEAIGRDIQIELMPWGIAQDQVQTGQRDLVTEMSITEARKRIWDFATPTLSHSFGLFVTNGEVGIHGIGDLQGKRVAVTARGLPREILGAKPGIGLIPVVSYQEGFALLKKGAVDAVAADTWVAGYILSKDRIEGVAMAGPPFTTLDYAIAVPKGQDALLREINAGLETLRKRGTIDAIRREWEPKQVVYLLKEQLTAIVITVAAVIVALLVAGLLIWIVTMRKEIAVRTRIENELRTSEQRFIGLNAELELRIAQRTAALEGANKELEAFSYSVSHDLRAPLRHLNSYSTLLLDLNKDRLGAESVNYLNRINAACSRMSLIIDDLLRLSRISRQGVDRQQVDLTWIAQEVANSLAKMHPERNVDVSVMPGMKAEADPGLVRIVLENLIGNAWKFTLHAYRPKITVGTEERDGRRTWCVRDNGSGFDMEYADKLFEPFQRLHTGAEYPGSGIGLSIVQRIVEKHGGTIAADSKPGQGAVFFFSFEKPGD
jgi:signal transduction histidine kinase